MTISKDDRVEWTWGRGTPSGRVTEILPERTIRIIKGSRIVRNGSPENPAVVIRMDDGGEVLKLASEVRLL
ncbi:DUF2945 domain-containing protein [Seohaeicola zhoushanensis]|uniref:Hypervirulence associated protein TUDOR domain-containing protein n=1 Tax=Seohaeicola zhoushanensis TaxID=1569283 RepID=A0A8J3M9W5_9RHOB|nr:DUF2945 domain-containing protein [Seohaeicola zhoushanensis]GHF69345.1 hypothetical protein GCM10017056_45500 [Seohaeicola zhoushanensis]